MITGHIEGITGHLVEVDEIAVNEMAIRELRVRARSALIESNLGEHVGRIEVKQGHMRAGGIFDLPVAMSAAGLDFNGLVIGELSLGGDIRGVRGALPICLAAKAAGITKALVPRDCIEEAMASGLVVYTASRLRDIAAGEVSKIEAYSAPKLGAHPPDPLPDGLQGKFDEVMAAIGEGRHVLLVGPLGSGKTMIARRVSWAMPRPTPEECLQISQIRSACGLTLAMVHVRPFRAPHHTASAAALLGESVNQCRPGEVTLAHGGVLFLDDVHMFQRSTLTALAGVVRSGSSYGMPAKLSLIAAAPLCHCYRQSGRCTCTKEQIDRHIERVDILMAHLETTLIELP